MIAVKDVLEHFLSRAEWVDRDSTVDRVVFGDPEAGVDRCLVTWMPSSAALRAMVERDIRLLICHEPTFWNHPDRRQEGSLRVADKMRFLEEHDLVVLRNHDSWDRWPDVGIPWAWAGHLGLAGPPAAVGARGYQHRYDIEPVPLDEFARRIAARGEAVGEPMVQVTGSRGKLVSKIGIGTGCGCSIDAYLEMGCDCSVVCDDGSCYWAGIQMAEDVDHPVIRVNHGTSEEPGMVTLARYVNENVEGLSAEHLPHGSTFRLVGAGGLSEDADAGESQ